MRKKWKKLWSALLAASMIAGSLGTVSAAKETDVPEKEKNIQTQSEEPGRYAIDPALEAAKELELSFDEKVEDTSGKENPVVMHGTPEYIEGKQGKALLLNKGGSKNYLSLGKSTSLQPQNLTIAFWMKAAQDLGGSEHMIMWNTTDGNHLGDGFYLTSLADQPLKLSVGNDYGGVTAAGDRSKFFPADEWVYIVVTYDSAKRTGAIYRNGVKCQLTQETSNELTSNANDEKYIGCNGVVYNSGYAQVAFDEFELYSKQASEDDVRAMYQKYAGELNDSDIVAADKEMLDPFENLDVNAITGNVTLPTFGINGSTITWESNEPSVISADGKVTRMEQEKEVTLTATISFGNAKDTKKFTVKVPAAVEKQLWVSYDMTIENGKLKDKMGRYDATLVNMDEKDLVKDKYGDSALNFTGNKSQYVKIPSGILENGAEEFTVNMRFQTPQKAYAWVFNLGTKDTNNYVFLNPIRAGGEMAFTLKANGQSEKSVYGNLITPGESTVATMVFHPDHTAKIYLDGKLAGTVKHGYNVSDIIKNGVKDPKDAIGYLGLSLYGADPGYIGTISVFDVYNYSMTDNQVWTAYSEKYLDLTDEDRVNEDLKALKLQSGDVETDQLELPAAGLNGTKITWESSNEDVIALDGTVKRPGKGEADAKVQLKATVSYGTISKTKTYEMKVLAEADTVGLQDFDLGMADVTDSYYDNASQKDIDFLKKFDPDRLLARFRETSGLSMQGKSPYGGWEGQLIAGHTLGHYLSACAQAYVTADNEADRTFMLERLKYLIDELKVCQDALGNGFIFGASFAGSNKDKNIYDQFERIERGTTTDTWVPWYTMHKLMTGLVHVYNYTNYEPSKEVASWLGDWIYERTSKWDAATQRRVLSVEYGGMNDCLYELYKITQKDEHAIAAHMFDEDALFEDVLTGDPSVISNKHANTTIPKFVGAMNRYRTLDGKTINGEKVDASKYLEYCEAFWDMVINHHSYITGGNSQWEHFRGADALDVNRTQCNCETCNTYNMLKLSRELFKITGSRKYADYYENTFINAIMSSINPEDGTTAYFQPMATGYHKVFGNSDPAQNTFWCCTGSGMENFTKLGDSIYFYKEDNGTKLIVNQYLSSVLTWDEKNLKITQTTSIPEKDMSEIKVNLLNGKESADFTLSLRIPDWTAGDPVVKINGEVQDVVISNGYAIIKRNFKDNDKVQITLPMDVTAHSLPDDNTVYGFKYGPVVLSAELGTDEAMKNRAYCGWSVALPASKRVGTETASPKDGVREVLSSETLQIKDMEIDEYIGSINDHMIRKDKEDGPLAFQLNGTDQDLTFSTHYKQYIQRYGIYWYFAGAKSNEDSEANILARKLESREARIKGDVVKPGYPQYETDSLHILQESGSVGGADADLNGATSRYAQADGYFSYRMAVEKGEKNFILCKLTKLDNGRTLKISVDGQIIFDEKLNHTGDDSIYEKKIEIPADLIEKAASVEITENGQKNTYDTVIVKVEGTASERSARLVSELYMTKDYSHDASLKALEAKPGAVSAQGNEYVVTVPKSTKLTQLKAQIADTYGLLYINDVLVNDTKAQDIALNGDVTELTLKVYAEDHETAKEYKVKIQKEEGQPDDQKGLIASLTFDDQQNGFSGSGAAAKAVGGTVKLSDDAIEGKGKSLDLDGSYYLELTKENGEPLLSGCKQLTISYLAYAKSGSMWSYYAQDKSSTPAKRDYIGVLDRGTSVTAERGDGKGTSPAKTVSASSDGWKMVTVVYTENKTTLYVNDRSDSFIVDGYELSEMLGEDNYFTIGAGAWNNYTERFNGCIDEFRVYNYAMSDADVKQMYVETLAGETLKQKIETKYIPKLDLSNVFADGAVMKSQNIKLTDELEDQGIKAKVTWTSSDSAIISPDGKVTYQDKDANVELTANVSIGTQTVQKKFTIPVLSKASQLASFEKEFIIKSYVKAGEKLPAAYGSGTVSYSGSDQVTADGIVSAKGDKTTETKVTANFTLDGQKKSRTFTIHILPKTAGELICYTRETGEYQFYPENLSYSMHLAYNGNGKAYAALNNNTGVLFAAGYYKNNENMATKVLDYPYLFYTKDGSYAVIAQFMDTGQTPTSPNLKYDEDHKGMVAIYTTDDLLHYSYEHFIKLSDDAYVKNAVCEYNTAIGKYVINWEDTNGKFYRTTMKDILDESTIEETVSSKVLSFDTAKTDVEDARNRNVLPVEKAVGEHVNTKLGKLVNTEVTVPEELTVTSAEDIQDVKATAVYSDGSTDEKDVTWNYADVDFQKKGTYTIQGTVDTGNNYGFGKALNKGGKVYCLDPQGNSTILNSGLNKINGSHDSAQDWADPNICYWKGKYYFVATNDWNGNIGIYIRESDTIEGLFAEGVKAYEIASYDKDKNHTAQFWAPELHEVNGKLCMFFAIGFYSRVMVLEGNDPKKQADWGEIHEVIYADNVRDEGNNGQYFNKRAMAIDMTYFESGDKSYVVWSGRESNNGWGKGAFLYIATCDKEKPWILTSKAVLLGRAEYSWEQQHGVVAEGPFVVKKDGKIYMTFSGASVDNTYSVGFMTAEEGKDLLVPENWLKNNYPILNSFSVENEYGPGHSCFFQKENGDVLFIYHGRGPNWNSPRTTGIRRVQFDAEGEPYLAMTDAEDVLEANRTVTMKVTVKEGEVSDKVKIDKSALKEALDKADKITDKDKYTEDSFKAFEAAKTEAAKAYKDIPDEALKTEAEKYAVTVKEMADKLNAAIKGLKEVEIEVVDKAALKKAIDDAKAKDTTKYSKDSVKKMEEALAEAEKVYADDKATQAQVDKVVKDLKDAVEGLKESVVSIFKDITDKDWYIDYAQYVYDRKIMTGLDDEHFGGAVDLSRAHFATILYRMEGKPETKDGKEFPDVPDGAFYAEAVAWASSKEVGVINGYADGTFGPADLITREQLATMMYRYAEYKGYDTSAESDLKDFDDRGKVSEFADKAMKWAVGSKIITGDQGLLNPQGKSSRAVCATIIQRFMEKYEVDVNVNK